MTTSRSHGTSSSGDVFAEAHSAATLAALEREPQRFDFFQAVRLVALAAARQGRGGDNDTIVRKSARGPLPYEEFVRFRALAGHAFPASAIASFTVKHATERSVRELAEMSVTFFGLFGPAGALPVNYTQLLIDSTRDKEFGFRDFLDLFNHRLIAQFYRAWEKNRYYVRYEQARVAGAHEIDPFGTMLYSLVGLGTPGVQGRSVLPDELCLYFGGHFARRPRSAVALQQIVEHSFGVSAQVCQFQGQWMELSSEERTRLTSFRMDDGQNRLGVTTIVGSRVWGVENKFLLRIGPLSHEEFRKFLPGGSAHLALAELVRLYAGPAMDVELQLVLAKTEVPRCRLMRDGRACLGWSAWLLSKEVCTDVADTVVKCSELPTH